MQQDLFNQDKPPEKKPEHDAFMWNQFAKLGEMIGDGEHNEPGGAWISREYRKLMHILVPETREIEREQRKLKAINIDLQMQNLMELKKCECGGTLKQARSGSKVAYCTDCNCRFKAKTVKKRT